MMSRRLTPGEKDDKSFGEKTGIGEQKRPFYFSVGEYIRLLII